MANPMRGPLPQTANSEPQNPCLDEPQLQNPPTPERFCHSVALITMLWKITGFNIRSFLKAANYNNPPDMALGGNQGYQTKANIVWTAQDHRD